MGDAGVDSIGKVAILGAGGMGTAMAVLLAGGGHPVRLWCRRAAFADELATARENKRYLSGIALPESIQPSSDPRLAVEEAELLIVAIPSAFLRETLREIAPLIPRAVPALSVIKGIAPGGGFAMPTKVITEELGPRPIAVLSGPSHAEEIAGGLPASVVIGGPDSELNRRVRDAINTDRFRVYSNPDPIGVELAGAIKNILGIASGICDGLGFGDNAKAGLLTRGLAEMARFGTHFGAQPATFLGLAGVGDLITTCYSPFGRNRALGERLGRGESLREITAATPKVAEGVLTCQSVTEVASEQAIPMPITEALYSILFEGKPPIAAVSDLMDRAPKDEWP